MTFPFCAQINFRNITSPTSHKTILLAILNWGLGHATRMVPVIDYLLSQKQNVILAGSGMSLEFLKSKYPELTTLELPDYNIWYPKSSNMRLAMLQQVPKIRSAIKLEHKITKKFINNNQVDKIISDNRYGVFSTEIQSIFICHQLRIQSDFGKEFIRKIHKVFIEKFDECWVPDYEKEPNLTGEMAHNSNLRIPIKYVGLLSQFENFTERNISTRKKHKLLVILSGPEPQRSLLERVLLKQIPESTNICLIRGTELPLEKSDNLNEQIEIHNLIHNSDFLHQKIIDSEYILSRPGYTSIMDYATLSIKKIGFIPTPGQNEQEYLAKRLSGLNIAYFEEQDSFKLEEFFKNCHKYSGFELRGQKSIANYKSILNTFLIN